MDPIRFHEAPCLTVFEPKTLGTRVEDIDAFLAILAAAVNKHDFSADLPVPGQGFVELPEAAVELVSAGVGPRTADPNDYVIRTHRGRVDAYLKRERAAKVKSVAAVVYTMEAYLNDPEVSRDEIEYCLARDSGATHVLVTVLASAGPRPPLSPLRFVANMAGGNNAQLAKTADELRAEARDVIGYDVEWCVVSD